MPHDERQAERQAKNSLFSLFSPSAELPRAWLLAERKFALETLFFYLLSFFDSPVSLLGSWPRLHPATRY